MNQVMRATKAKNDRLLSSAKQGIAIPIGNPIVQESAALVRVLVSLGSDDAHWPILSQLTRSLNSIGANLMEGLGRSDTQDGLRFVKIARGSAYESVYHALCLTDTIRPSYYKRIQALAEDIDAYILDTLKTLD